MIVNPVTAKAAITPYIIDIIDTLENNGYDVTVHIGKYKGDCTDFIKAIGSRFDVIVACGGDGTLSETVSAVLTLDKKPEIGYIPSGTTNDFAVSWKISRKPMEAATNIAENEPRLCDVSTFCGKPFVYVAAFGAFTEASYSTPQELKKSIGWIAYIIEGIKSLPSIKPIKMKIEYDGGVIEDEFLYGMISNTRHVGGFELKVSDDVSLSDGLMELILIRNPKNSADNPKMLSAVLNQDASSEYITFVHTKKVRFETDEDVSWTIDGENGGVIKEGEAEVIPAAVRLYY